MAELRDTLQETLGEKYHILRELTGGGMSRVFLAHDSALQRDVVVKLLSPELIDAGRVERFRQEVLQTARLQHPTIVPVIEVGAIEPAPGHPVPYYIMPYARGESLRSRLHHEGHLSVGLAMRVLRSVFDALAYAHSHGVVHRDIKPENVFLSGTNALLADFGIAKAIAGPGSRSSVTSPGMAVGTPSYMSPEQIVDGDRIGPASDLYAAGVLGFEMLTGRLPWEQLTPVEILAIQARGRITPLRSLRPEVPPAMAQIIESCLAWDPTNRPESAAAALRALEAVSVQRSPDSGSHTPVTDTPATASAPRKTRRQPALMAMMAFLAVVVVAGFAQLWSSQRDGPVVGSMRELAVLYPEIPAQTSDRAEVSARLYQMLTSTLAPVSGLRLVGRVSVPRLAAQGLRSAQIDDSLRAEGVDSALALSATVSTSGALMLALELRSLADRGVETVGGPITVMSIERVAPDSLLVIVRQLAAQGVAKMHLGSSNRAVSETQRIDAYMTWLSGRDGMARRSPEGINAAVALFERAIALDSAYAQAHADLSQTLSLALFYHYRLAASPYEMAARAMSHADRAVKLNPELADGYLARALLGTVAGAPTTFVQANFDSVARYPGANPYSQTFYLGLLAKLGNFDEAVQRAEEEVRLDGRSAGQRIASAVYSLPAGQYLTALRNATAARDLLRDVPMVSQLELISRLRLDGKALADCVNVAAGPYIGARALCLERVGRENDGRALSDSLFAMLTGKAAMDSTFDLALYLGEMAMYGAQHLEREAMRQWLSQAFKESPAGVDFRIMRSGIFDKSAIQFADSVQLLGWSRVLRTPATRAPAVSP